MFMIGRMLQHQLFYVNTLIARWGKPALTETDNHRGVTASSDCVLLGLVKPSNENIS